MAWLGRYENIFPNCETQLEAGGKTFASCHLTVQFGVPTWAEFFAILVDFGVVCVRECVCVCVSAASVAGASFGCHVFWCKVFAAFSIFYESSFCVNTLSTQGIVVEERRGGGVCGKQQGGPGCCKCSTCGRK